MTSPQTRRSVSPDHEAVARMVERTFHLGGGSSLAPYLGLALVLRARLTGGERQGLAWAALMACDTAEVRGIAEAVLQAPMGAGEPLPPFLDAAEDALWWADVASPDELRAYALAAYFALSPADQRDFLAVAQRRTAA